MECGTSRVSRSRWTYLLLILILVAQSKQETANDIETTLQELKTLILGRLDDMDQKLLRMDSKCGQVDTTLVEVIKGKVENIEIEVVAIGERSSHGLTFIDNAMKGPVNDAKEQGAAILKEIKQLKQKSDLFDDTINTLILNNKQMSSKLDSIDNQLNRTIGSLTYNDNIIIEEVQLLKEGDRSMSSKLDSIDNQLNQTIGSLTYNDNIIIEEVQLLKEGDKSFTLLVNEIKGKVTNIEHEITAIGERSSHAITLIDNAMQGPVNEIKEQGTSILKETNLIKQKSDMLLLNNVQKEAKLEKIHQQLNQDVAKCVGGVIIGYQCLKYSQEAEDWETAKAACASNFSRLASLADPDAVLAYTIGKYGTEEQFWAGGHGTGKEDKAWSAIRNACIRQNNYKTFNGLTIDVCKEKCLDELGMNCQSIDYEPPNQKCYISMARSNSADYTEPCYDSQEAEYSEILQKSRNWEWINGSPFDHIPWAENEPNNEAGDEHCLSVNWRRGYNDAPCTHKLRYICEPVDARCVGGVNIGNQCLMFSHKPMNWEAAKAACASNSNQLASLADPDATLAYDIGKYGSERFWAGGYDIGNEDNWVWLNGDHFEQFPWGNTQPNNLGGDQNCLSMHRDRGFDDIECGAVLRYICETGSTGEYSSADITRV